MQIPLYFCNMGLQIKIVYLKLTESKILLNCIVLLSSSLITFVSFNLFDNNAQIFLFDYY